MLYTDSFSGLTDREQKAMENYGQKLFQSDNSCYWWEMVFLLCTATNELYYMNSSKPVIQAIQEFLKNFSGVYVMNIYQVYHKLKRNVKIWKLPDTGWVHARRRLDETVKALSKAN